MKLASILPIALLGIASSSAAQITTQGAEPNGTKAEATVAPPMVPGDSIEAFTCGLTGLNLFRVSTAPLPQDIYRHTLENFGGGRTRVFGSDALVDSVLPGSFRELQDPMFVEPLSGAGSSNQVSWYGFGRSEELYVDLQSFNVCRGPASLTLATEAVVPLDLGSAPVTNTFEGTARITFSVTRSGGTVPVDPSVQLYDSELRALPAHGLDDGSFFGQGVFIDSSLRPGRYYFAVGDGRLASHLAPHRQRQEADLPAPVNDFDGCLLNSSPHLLSELSVRFGSTPAVMVTKTKPFEVSWFTFTVEGAESVSTFCEGDGTLAPCPCGVNSPLASGKGCPNSTGRGASIMTWRTHQSANPYGISMFDLPPGQFAMPFMSFTAQGANPAAAGLFCLGSAGSQRLGLVSSDSAGNAELEVEFASLPGVMTGQTLFFQGAYRDPQAAGGCQVNFTSGTALSWR